MEDIKIEHIDGVPLIRIQRVTPFKEKRPIWTNDEVIKMLRIMKEKKIVSLLYGGKYRKGDVFKVVAANLKKFGYLRTAEQISTKWKHLRLTYAHAKAESRSGNSVAKEECPYYNEMDELLGERLQIVVDSSVYNEPESKVEEILPDIRDTTEEIIEAEVHMEVSENELSQAEFSQIEVVHTDISETEVSIPGPSSNHEENVLGLIEIEEPQDHLEYSQTVISEPQDHLEYSQTVISEPQDHMEYSQTVISEPQDHMEYSQMVISEPTFIETSPVKRTRKRRMCRIPPGRLRKSNEGTYSNALKSFTKEWEAMMVRVAEKEREEDRSEKERELTEQRRWEERLIEQQSAAMSKANSEFLAGLRGLFDELKK